MAEKTARGQVRWHELHTPDTGASHTFYARVLGWKSQPWEHDPSYKMFAASTGPLGGTAQTEGPAHWLHYIEASDIDAATEEAAGLGATVQTPPTALPNGGRYAVLADPQGAQFALVASTTPSGGPKPPKRGEFSWMELATTDVKAAMDFYGRLFGWEVTQEHDMGPLGVYYIIGSGGRDFGGAYTKSAEMPGPSNWLGYVRVKDLDKTVKAATKAGATLLNGPMEVPGGDWIAQLLDPQGAMFAVHTLAADRKSAAPASSAPTAETATQTPAKIEVTSAPAQGSEPAAKTPARKTASSKAATKTGSKAKAKAKAKTKAAAKSKSAPAKRKAAKSVKRSAGKAVKVGSRTKLKAKAAPKRKKTAGKAKKKAGARARKGK
jgi:hypothetical protein